MVMGVLVVVAIFPTRAFILTSRDARREVEAVGGEIDYDVASGCVEHLRTTW
jgi:hypothetical protein